MKVMSVRIVKFHFELEFDVDYDTLDLDLCRSALSALGFREVYKRAFRSGSVSAAHP